MPQGAYAPTSRGNYNPLSFFTGMTGGNTQNQVNTGSSYSSDPGISWRDVINPENWAGRSYADASNTMSNVTPDMMHDMMTGMFSQPGSGGSAPSFNGFNPVSAGPYQSPGQYQSPGSFQGYTAGDFNGPQVSAPGAWGGYDINTPGGWTPRDIDVNTTATQDAINAQLPWIEEQRDLGFADAGARAGQSGFAMSTPYMESLGGVARQASNDTQAMAEQFLFQAEESARQREIQAEMQQLELEKQAWQQQGNWDMAAQVTEAQNSLASWQTQGGWDMAAQLGNQQTSLGAYQTQQQVNSQNALAANQFALQSAGMANDYGLASAGMANDYGLASAGMQNQYGFANTEMMNNLAMRAWEMGINNEQDWNAFIYNGMRDQGFGGMG